MGKCIAFAAIILLGVMVAKPDVSFSASEVIAQGKPPTPPPVIPAWILGGGHFYGSSPDVDPGATPDQHLFAGVLDASATANATLGTNCPGLSAGGSNVSNCNPYLYINMLDLLCDDTPLSSEAYTYLNLPAHKDESGFVHLYASPTPGPRVTDPAGSCPTPDVNPYPEITSPAGYFTNPDDAGFQSWLVTNAWTKSIFPAPYGIFEDHFSVIGDQPCAYSYEYGGRACSQRGTSGSPAPHDWETALGDFESNAEANCGTTCFAFIGNGLTPGGGNNTNPCNNIIPTVPMCWATFDSGIVNDMDALDNVCAAADSNGHLQAIAAEEIVYLKGPQPSPTPSPFYANPQTIVYMINTMSHLVNYTSGGCANTVAIDVESSGGSFPGLPKYAAGTVTAGYQIRQEATALRFLVPDPKTQIPDRMQPFYFQIGATVNTVPCNTVSLCEVPYFFEETMVPQDPEVTVAAFQWNGTTPTVGDGCPAPNPGDTGGAVDLMVACVNDPGSSTDGAAIFLQEYHHLYIDGNDYGPAAVLLNTASETAVPISSTWFCSTCDPITSFSKQLNLNGGELTSVLYGGGTIPLPCTAATYCNGNNTVTGNTTSFSSSSPGSIGPDSGIILLGSN